MKKTIVLKFGGSCLGPLSSDMAKEFINIENEIKKYKNDGYNIIAVVSAPKGFTRQLHEVSLSLIKDGNHKFLDPILGSGEEISTKTLSAYLNSKNIKTEYFLENQLPIVTDDKYGAANIINVKTNLIKKAFAKDSVVICPGYIGRTKDGEATTIGFDGSDTTAVYLTSALKAEECVLYKDVEGVYPVRPDHISHSIKPFSELSLDDMYYYSLLGARIVHPKSIEQAIKKDLIIRVKSITGKGEGTVISNKVENKDVIGITYLNKTVNQPSFDGTYLSIIGKDIDINKILPLNKKIEEKKIIEIIKDELQEEIEIPKNKFKTIFLENKNHKEFTDQLYINLFMK